ncbi:MAG TPA: HDOD domain-containing protein [Candidatus Cloacimonadota bacterium]|nr:HDOD domain-containing protein [Candidatus Cloacimonadota bacterium]HOQ80435.1 HDOD domain-containing protein [Candidatus Cloacimonadota bacterium]
MPKTINEIKSVLAKIDNLPTLPVVASELLRIIGTSSTSMSQISELMNNDQSITARVLKIANSAYYGIRNRVDTLRTALVILGINEISNIVVGVSLIKVFDSDDEKLFDYQAFWKHSIYTAHLARWLSRKMAIPFHGEEFTAGLLHDIGKIILDQYFHNEFVSIRKYMELFPQDQEYEIEQKILGATHMELGYWLADQWKIPTHIQSAIQFHHRPEKATENIELCCLINIVNTISNYYVNPIRHERIYREIPSSFSWGKLNKLKKLDFADLEREIEEEIEKANSFVEQMN